YGTIISSRFSTMLYEVLGGVFSYADAVFSLTVYLVVLVVYCGISFFGFCFIFEFLDY
ncbi:unnamed protein product, partial [marine sediment metagenome]